MRRYKDASCEDTSKRRYKDASCEDTSREEYVPCTSDETSRTNNDEKNTKNKKKDHIYALNAYKDEKKRRENKKILKMNEKKYNQREDKDRDKDNTVVNIDTESDIEPKIQQDTIDNDKEDHTSSTQKGDVEQRHELADDHILKALEATKDHGGGHWLGLLRTKNGSDVDKEWINKRFETEKLKSLNDVEDIMKWRENINEIQCENALELEMIVIQNENEIENYKDKELTDLRISSKEKVKARDTDEFRREKNGKKGNKPQIAVEGLKRENHEPIKIDEDYDIVSERIRILFDEFDNAQTPENKQIIEDSHERIVDTIDTNDERAKRILHNPLYIGRIFVFIAMILLIVDYGSHDRKQIELTTNPQYNAITNIFKHSNMDYTLDNDDDLNIEIKGYVAEYFDCRWIPEVYARKEIDDKYQCYDLSSEIKDAKHKNGRNFVREEESNDTLLAAHHLMYFGGKQSKFDDCNDISRDIWYYDLNKRHPQWKLYESVKEEVNDDIIADAFKLFSIEQEIETENEEQYVDVDMEEYLTEFEEALDDARAVAKVEQYNESKADKVVSISKPPDPIHFEVEAEEESDEDDETTSSQIAFILKLDEFAKDDIIKNAFSVIGFDSETETETEGHYIDGDEYGLKFEEVLENARAVVNDDDYDTNDGKEQDDSLELQQLEGIEKDDDIEAENEEQYVDVDLDEYLTEFEETLDNGNEYNADKAGIIRKPPFISNAPQYLWYIRTIYHEIYNEEWKKTHIKTRVVYAVLKIIVLIWTLKELTKMVRYHLVSECITYYILLSLILGPILSGDFIIWVYNDKMRMKQDIRPSTPYHSKQYESVKGDEWTLKYGLSYYNNENDAKYGLTYYIDENDAKYGREPPDPALDSSIDNTKEFITTETNDEDEAKAMTRDILDEDDVSVFSKVANVQRHPCVLKKYDESSKKLNVHSSYPSSSHPTPREKEVITVATISKMREDKALRIVFKAYNMNDEANDVSKEQIQQNVTVKKNDGICVLKSDVTHDTLRDELMQYMTESEYNVLSEFTDIYLDAEFSQQNIEAGVNEFGIPLLDKISKHHIIALIAYCNNAEIRKALDAMHKRQNGENDTDLIKRHCNLYYLAKLLRQSDKCYWTANKMNSSSIYPSFSTSKNGYNKFETHSTNQLLLSHTTPDQHHCTPLTNRKIADCLRFILESYKGNQRAHLEKNNNINLDHKDYKHHEEKAAELELKTIQKQQSKDEISFGLNLAIITMYEEMEIHLNENTTTMDSNKWDDIDTKDIEYIMKAFDDDESLQQNENYEYYQKQEYTKDESVHIGDNCSDKAFMEFRGGNGVYVQDSESEAATEERAYDVDKDIAAAVFNDMAVVRLNEYGYKPHGNNVLRVYVAIRTRDELDDLNLRRENETRIQNATDYDEEDIIESKGGITQQNEDHEYYHESSEFDYLAKEHCNKMDVNLIENKVLLDALGFVMNIQTLGENTKDREHINRRYNEASVVTHMDGLKDNKVAHRGRGKGRIYQQNQTQSYQRRTGEREIVMDQNPQNDNYEYYQKQVYQEENKHKTESKETNAINNINGDRIKEDKKSRPAKNYEDSKFDDSKQQYNDNDMIITDKEATESEDIKYILFKHIRGWCSTKGTVKDRTQDTYLNVNTKTIDIKIKIQNGYKYHLKDKNIDLLRIIGEEINAKTLILPRIIVFEDRMLFDFDDTDLLNIFGIQTLGILYTHQILGKLWPLKH